MCKAHPPSKAIQNVWISLIFFNTEVFYITTKEKNTLEEILLLFQSHLNTQIEHVEQIIQPRLNTNWSKTTVLF